MQETKFKGPIEYIKEAWRIYTKKENFIFFAKIMAVLVIISTSISYLHTFMSKYVMDSATANISFNNIPLATVYIFLIILSFVFYFYQSSTTYSAILNMNSEEKNIFKLGYKNMAKLFLISFVLWIIVFFGLILLLVPGILFVTWYQFSTYLVLDKNLKVGAALKQSKAMVKGRFWKIVGINFIFALLYLVIGFISTLIPYVGNILSMFIAPFLMLPTYLLYRDLSINN